MSAPLGRLRLPWVDLPLFGLLLACAPVCALPDLPEQVGLGPGGASLLERAALPQVLGLAQVQRLVTGRQKIGARNRKVWKRVNVSNNPLDSKEFLERLRREWADSCNALLPGYAVIDHRSFKARGIERIPTIHEGYASREMEKRGGRGDLCEENRRIQALNRLLDALRAMIGRLSDQAQGILTAVKRRQRPSGAPQAPSSPEPAERPQERPQARETPPQAPQEPPKPIRTKKALTDRFKTRLDERLAENERKQAEKQAEPDMEETWDLSDPADPLNIGMGWGTGGHGLGL